jgi:hypothetical protein
MAAALAADRGASPAESFARYETAHRAVVEPKLNGYRVAAALLLPATRAGIATRNLVTRAVAGPDRRTSRRTRSSCR